MHKLVFVLKAYYEYGFIGVGVFFILATIFGCGNVNQYSTADSGKLYKRFIYEKWGEKGYQVLNIIMGVFLVIAGFLFLVLK